LSTAYSVEFSNNEEGAKLEVYCYALKKIEVDELIIMLEEKNFKLVFVDRNSIKTVKDGNYRGKYIKPGRN